MRRITDLSDLRVSLVGIVSGTGATVNTCYGNSIDTYGFSEVLGIAVMGAIWGTADSYADVYVRFQESAIVNGTGAAYTDITDGFPCGSFDVGAITVASPGASKPPTVNYGGVEYMQLNDPNRKRYIRPVVSVTGVAGTLPMYIPITVSVLLGGAKRSELVQNATSFGTSLREVAAANYGFLWGTTVKAN